MQRALELAREGVGLTSPNPAVGAVIIDAKGQIIGSDFHTYDGLKHAEVLAIEQLYFGANVRTAFAVGQARGVVLLAAGQRSVPTRSYTPQQVKAAVCGNGRADKDQVARMVSRLLGLGGAAMPDHTTDALAVAICELNRAPLARAVAGV